MRASNDSLISCDFENPGTQSVGFGALSFLISVWLLIISTEVCRGQDVREAEEYRVKAALLYNTCKFVTWPKNRSTKNDSEFVFYVVGKAPLLRALQSIGGKKIGGRSIKTLAISNIKDVGSCRVLFCSTEDLRSCSQAQLQRLADSHVLTVGETEGFLEAGGIVELSVVEKRLVFTINLAAARRANLEMSGALLRLAKEIVDP